MKTFIIAHLVVAALVFIILYLIIEIRTSEMTKAICSATGQSYMHYGRMIFISLIWELALVFLLLIIIAEIISNVIKLIRSKGDK